MEAPVDHAYGNGSLEEQAAPQALQELQAAVQDGQVHAMPVVGAFQDALGGEGGGSPGDQGMTGDDDTPGMHMGGMAGRNRMSSGSFKARVGPLFCQVEGCALPLEDLKEYHQRYKVCEEHLKVPFIVRDGQQVRFCQQCGRFQPLEDFDDQKRSCRVRLQRHNARRRKRPRDGGEMSDHYGGGGGGHHHHGVGVTAATIADMAKLASSYGGAGMAVSPKEIQAMQEALQFASTTLMHSSQVVTLGKPAGEEGEGGDMGGSGCMGPNSMPFVPTPDVMMLLLKGYAAMFHYVLHDATLRPLAPPSDMPDNQGMPGSMGLGAIDAIQMQQLMQAQGFLGGGPNIPLMLAGGEGAAAAGLLHQVQQEQEQQQLAAGEGQQEQGQEGGDAEQLQQQHEGQHEGQQHEQQQQQMHEELLAGQELLAGLTAAVQQHHGLDLAAAQAAAAAVAAAGGAGDLTAEQVAAALIQPMPTDAAEGAAAGSGAHHHQAHISAADHLSQAGIDLGQLDPAALAAATLAAHQAHHQQQAQQMEVEEPLAAAMGQQQLPVTIEVPAEGGGAGMQADQQQQQ